MIMSIILITITAVDRNNEATLASPRGAPAPLEPPKDLLIRDYKILTFH